MEQMVEKFYRSHLNIARLRNSHILYPRCTLQNVVIFDVKLDIEEINKYFIFKESNKTSSLFIDVHFMSYKMLDKDGFFEHQVYVSADCLEEDNREYLEKEYDRINSMSKDFNEFLDIKDTDSLHKLYDVLYLERFCLNDFNWVDSKINFIERMKNFDGTAITDIRRYFKTFENITSMHVYTRTLSYYFKFTEFSDVHLKKCNGYIYLEKITVNYKPLKDLDLFTDDLKNIVIRKYHDNIINSALVFIRRNEKYSLYLRKQKEYEFDIKINDNGDLSVTACTTKETIKILKSLNNSEGIYSYITNYKAVEELRDEAVPTKPFFGYHVEIGITSHNKTYNELKDMIKMYSIVFQNIAIETLKRSPLFKRRKIEIEELRITSIVLTRDERIVFKFDLKQLESNKNK